MQEDVWSEDVFAGVDVQQPADPTARARARLLDEVASDLRVPVDPAVLSGHVGRTLVGHASAQDVVVVGSRGRRAPVGAVLGSTSLYVAEHARCPVVVVRARYAG